ncbi:MAG: RHS repeat-associated core domain-containing protein [Pseudorhodoplanes sp.]|nr:RHS repeat-associated core domain-containing protein [Pseudorhodoplanes sp.]
MQLHVGNAAVLTDVRDSQRRIIRRQMGSRAATAYEYNAAGILQKLLPPGKAEIQLDYTPAGRPRSITYGDGSVKELVWNEAGQIREIRQRDGSRISREYDQFGRISVQREFRRAEEDSPAGESRFRYDAADRVVQAVTRDSDTQRLFDAGGRLLSEFQSGLAVSYRYDVHGRRAALIYPDGSEVRYEYGRPSNGAGAQSVRHPDKLGAIEGSWFGRIEFEYNADNRLETTRYTTINTAVTRTYDQHGLVASIRVHRGDESIWLYSTQRDARGLVLSEMDSRGWQRTYGHEPIGWLTRAAGSDMPESRFNYDDAGNLRNTSGTEAVLSIDAAGQVEAASGVSVERSGGNTTKLGGNQFEFDVLGRLVASRGQVQKRYGYDALDRLLWWQREGAERRRLVYDGWTLIAEYAGAEPEAKAPATRIIHAPGLDHPLAMQRDGKLYFFVQDPRNSVVLLLDSTGTPSARFAYAPFGERTIIEGDIQTPFGFAGALCDEDLGICHMRMRAYCPALGRFLQPDPTDFAGGDNLYVYARNAPLEFIDPSGMGVQEWATRIVTDPGSNSLSRFGATLVGAGAMVLAGEGETRVEKYGEAANTVGNIIETAGDIVAVAHPALTPWGAAISAEGKLFKAGGDVLKGEVTLDTVSNLASGATGVYGTVGKVAGRVTAMVDGLSAGKTPWHSPRLATRRNSPARHSPSVSGRSRATQSRKRRPLPRPSKPNMTRRRRNMP